MECAIYTTYAIIDPGSRLCVYVGQTNDMERRQAQHLTPPRLRTDKPKPGSLQNWLAGKYRAKITPDFMILEVVETEAESLQSETKWIEKFATIGHPLLNRWEEHAALIEAGKAPADIEAGDFTAYWPGKWNKVIATMKPTLKGDGFTLTFPEETTVKADGRLVIMPTKTTGIE
ncbi:MAG: GIY-YIG nuclease family protein [Pseudomonadota bacterium]